MSFFDSVKKSLGIGKDRSATAGGGGHPAFDKFDITFTEETLGIGIVKYNGSMPHLPPQDANSLERSCPIVTLFDSRNHDVRPGDLIIALEGNNITSFEDFAVIVKAVGRPVRITFLRFRDNQQRAVNGASSTGQAVSGTTGNALSSLNPLKMLGGVSGGKGGRTAQPVVLTEEEKKARREKLSAAALDRSQSWDRKLGQKKQSAPNGGRSPIVDQYTDGSGPQGEVSEETEAAIRRAKAAEAKMEQELGYSPFRPHMSFTGSSASKLPAPSVPAHVGAAPRPNPVRSAATGVAPYPYAVPGEDGAGEERLAVEEALAEGDVDDALAMLLSLGEADQERGRVAVTTVLKMVSNLHNNPGDQKLRSIRVSNRAFQSKVASVPGGTALLLAAGYRYTGGSAGGELAGQVAQPSPSGSSSAVSGNSEGGEPLLHSGTDGAAAEPAEQFLVHPVDAPAVRRLRYTLLRMQELIEGTGGSSTPASPK